MLFSCSVSYRASASEPLFRQFHGEVRRIPLLGTPVNKGKKTKGRGSISAQRPLFSYQPTSPKTQDTKASECCLSSYY